MDNQTNSAPPLNEIARRAYFNHEKEGSLPGREVRDWLKAEAELIAERNVTRIAAC